ncbi:cytochrome c1 [Algihabitans albus]|uniref:cytochrome c1 n=1 Tax=Algihabitans albus TaxID=2164067 RepID=UPI000E5D56D2|nr:cytochrome c1 [Algihabitans albus]
MLKRLAVSAVTAATLFVAAADRPSEAAEAVAIPNYDFSFEGVFGTFDQMELQRGFQVYREVCSACHGLRLVSFRNLVDLGYSEDEIKALAAEYMVEDGPDENGEMFMRAGIPADRIPSPYRNVNEARALNGGAYPPDLSLMAKKRKGGPDYIKALLVGYGEPPADVELMPGMYWNDYFPGHQIAMPQILYPDSVSFADGTEATLEQQSLDLATFLMWTAEPMMDTRKQTGISVILFLLVFTGLMYAVKRKVWADLH